MLAIQLICHTLNEEIMKISILTHETGLSESSNRAVAEEAFTPQKRAADIRPKRVMKSASKDRNNHINSERGKESSTDSKYAFSRRKRFENFPTNPAAVTNLPFFACSFDHSSSDEFDDAVDELTQECGEDRLGSSDAINFHDYRGVNFDELLFSAKHLEMPSQFSDSSHHVTESEISQSNDLITADIVNDTANDLNIGFKISAELQLGLVDAEVLKFVFGREERRGTPLESPQLLSESLKCVDTPEREISRVHSQSWLRSVSHNRRTSSHYFSDRKKLVNNWNLPRVKSAVDNGSLDLDIDSMWNNVLRSTVFPRPLTDDTNVDSSAELKMHWDHVAVCFRNLIPLLFQNDDIVLKMRFELFHVVVCYLGRGPRRIRYGVQTLVINVVNSLYMWHLKQQDIKETNDVQATIAILHQKLAYFSSPAFRYVCCTAVDLSIPDVSEIIDGLVHIATSFTSPNYFLPDNNSTMDWLENNVYCICGLSPSPNCFRNVLAVNRIIAINEPGLNFPKYMSIIVKSLGAALMSSDGSAQNNALVDAVLKSLGDGAHRFSERLLQTVFWFSLIAIQFSPQNSLMYPLNLALDILLEISSRSSRDLEQKIFEEELIDTALSGSSSEFRNSSKSNRFVLIDILAELSRDNLLGVPLLSKSKLSYAISVLLIRCAHVTSSREICVRILIILDKMYIRRRGSEKYGISGYACMLQCIIGHNEPGCSDTSNEDCADNSSERGSNFFGAANFPTVTSAIQYATMLLCISRHFLSTAIKIRAHRFILSFIQAMPALGICLHQLIFEELTREFDSAAPSETEILKLIRQSLDVFFRFVLSSHPIGRYFNHLAPPDGIKKKLKAYERLIDNRSISYDEALGAEEASDEFAAVDESAVADVAFTSPPPSPHYSISSNQSTPVGSAHNDKWGQGDKLLQGDEPVSHLNEHVSILESTPAARENVIEGGVCKEIIHYFGAYNAIETMSLKTADQTAPAALPVRLFIAFLWVLFLMHSYTFWQVRPQLISIGCDILRLAVLDLEDME